MPAVGCTSCEPLRAVAEVNMRWNFNEHAMLSPRERMHASLQGFGATRANIEVRGAAGNFEQLIKNTASAPAVPDVLLRGDHLVRGGAKFDPARVKNVFARSPRNGVQLTGAPVRIEVPTRFGALPQLQPRLNIKLPSLETTPGTVTPPGTNNLPEPDNSRALPPPMVPGNDPATVNTEAAGTAVTDTTAGGAAGPAPVTTVAPMAATAPVGLAPWKLAVGAAALFGGIWYFTRK